MYIHYHLKTKYSPCFAIQGTPPQAAGSRPVGVDQETLPSLAKLAITCEFQLDYMICNGHIWRFPKIP
jgi:hypothetical protein